MGYLLIGAILFLVLALIYMLLRAGRHYAHIRGDPILMYRRVVALKKEHARLRARIEASHERARTRDQRLNSQSPNTPNDPTE